MELHKSLSVHKEITIQVLKVRKLTIKVDMKHFILGVGTSVPWAILLILAKILLNIISLLFPWSNYLGFTIVPNTRKFVH
jgi:hypothetical protein